MQLGLGDDERRREAQGRAVGVLGQHTAVGQREADLLAGRERRVDVDARPQAERADAGDALAQETVEPGAQDVALPLVTATGSTASSSSPSATAASNQRW